jgi:hypothetical protein
MQARAEKFRAVLVAELDDLVQDLKEAESLYTTRYASGQVSGYVLMENTAVLEQEIAAVMAVQAALRGRSLPAHPCSADSVQTWFEVLCREVLAKNDYPTGILGFLVRRCTKVARYVYEE